MAKKPKGQQGPGGVDIQTLEPDYTYNTAKQLWVGPPKCGKTSTFASLKTIAEEYGLDEVKPFLMLFESGSGGVEVDCTQEPDGAGTKRKVLSNLKETREWFEWAAASEFNPIGIDTGDAMYQLVADGVCERLGIPSPTASDHGTAWLDIYDEFRDLLGILDNKGVVVLMHVYMQERRVTGGTVQTATFNVSGKSKPYLSGWADQILHYRTVPNGDEDKNIITTRMEVGIEAGDRWNLFPEELDRGNTPDEAAKGILGCFYTFED